MTRARARARPSVHASRPVRPVVRLVRRPIRRPIRHIVSLAACLALLGACAGPGGSAPGGHRALALAGAAGDGPGDVARALAARPEPVRDLPRSARGNADGYTVFGRTYRVLDSAHGHTEHGTASWYGSKFHGRETSSGEPYDMHRLTAAHRSLPLPTFVRVTRRDTGTSVVVKVNDRGPFIEDREIDLSYAAAAQLDMLDEGTAPVTIEALSGHLPTGQGVAVAVAAPSPVAPGATDAALVAPAPPGAHWIQLGAFGDPVNARALYDATATTVALPARLEHDPAAGLYRVRLGPFAGPGELDRAAAVLANAGLDGYTLVSGAQRAPER